MIYDISVAVHDSMHVWPSDPKVRLESDRYPSRDGSHTIRVTSIHCGSHTGTHLDAPSHMLNHGRTLSDIPLEDLVGRVRVVPILGVRAIERSALESEDWEGVERVLFKTDNSEHWAEDRFYEDFVHLEPSGARFLIEKGIRLVGIDYLSIDGYRSVNHPSHIVLLENSVVILEGLNLSGVPEGDYQLFALPLKLVHTDGAPVRAILMNCKDTNADSRD